MAKKLNNPNKTEQNSANPNRKNRRNITKRGKNKVDTDTARGKM